MEPVSGRRRRPSPTIGLQRETAYHQSSCPCEAAPISIHYVPPSWYLVRAILPPSWYLSCCIHRRLHARYGAGIGSEARLSFL
ncbi:hypothetical protein SORBI_3006G256000 [Sorghum bicolor]|uniref:Uncharacterized protein n=1 Tax=Sorghum bicolor TaxID=4558 RepID=A0A1B6PNW6_SORBI|nr:hypothetical protein SORBI_3006G256000 [Sorghum bicolor]